MEVIMAILFARMECVKRVSGKNACAKAAYNSRDKVHFNGNEFNTEKTYNWSRLGKPEHHEILLPKGASEKFASKEILWNLVETTENRKNSRVGYELVIALPDDVIVTRSDKVNMAIEFAKKHFVEKGFAVQVDVHQPEPDQTKAEHNWHAHLFIAPRRFNPGGDGFDKNKARDLLPPVRGGKVIAESHWGQIWAEEQNQYFEKKGWDLRVDPAGVVSQKHLGPVRMRGRAFSLFEEQEQLKELNEITSQDPKTLLSKITETKNIFTPEDLDRYLVKHLLSTLYNF
jgi:MobA/MobL family